MNGVRSAIRKPFIDHVSELRKRLLWVALIVTAFSCGAFAIHQQILDIIQRPLGQTLYFTSPTGGLSFVLQLCLTVGVILGFPVIVYHIYQFISPLWQKSKKLGVFYYIFASFALACSGVLFAYYISLPAAIKFLTQFGGENVQALIKANEYFSFALAYLGGFALLFQIPLIIALINRVTPLGPRKMLASQKWIILMSFAAAAIITPTPDPINQFILAAPAVLLYQLSIIMIWLINKKPLKVKTARSGQTTSVPQNQSPMPPSPPHPRYVVPISDFVGPSSPATHRSLPSANTAMSARPLTKPAFIKLSPTKSLDGIISSLAPFK